MACFVLVPATQRDLDTMPPPLLAGIAAGFDSAEEAVEELRAVIAQFDQVVRPPQWSQFWSHDLLGDRYVGIAGFKAAPRPEGVEIAYFTFPRFEGRSFATEAVQHLVYRSRRAVNQVIAHTLPQESASTSVLKRCGFALAGEFIDPEDGHVWRWVKEPGQS